MPCFETGKRYAEEMLLASPMGLRLTKEGLNVAMNAPGLEAAVAIENRNQVLCSRTKDAQEGMRAFIRTTAGISGSLAIN